jgi:acetyl/propionyl-CoA carboxylase alpha subunit
MLAKLIVKGNTREEALNRMERALHNYRINGVRTIIPFLIAVIRHPVFRSGWFDTGFIENDFDFAVLDKMKEEYEEMIAAIAAVSYRNLKDTTFPIAAPPSQSKWKLGRMNNRQKD